METTKAKSHFAEKLLTKGLLTQAQLDLALREQKQNGGQIGPILVQFGFISGESLSKLLAEEAEAKAIDLNRATIDPDLIKLIPLDMARRFVAMPVARNHSSMTVALADPFNVVAIDTLSQYTNLEIDIVTAPERDILNCQNLHYNVGESLESYIDQALEEKSEDEVKDLEAGLSRQGDTDDDAPVIRLVSQIISRAVNSGASDIHFEPEERLMRIRARVDGVLNQDALIPKAMQSAVTARMKILADLDVAETRVPQDGRATISVAGRPINLRVSSLPTSYGENVVARILDPSAQMVTLGSLGLEEDVQKSFYDAISKPYGVVLVTGPTGSGKSTTLYAVLQEVATIEVSTFTLEDPVEYRIPLVRQTQVREEIGLTFSAGLRALLRQDPDIILVGETRDTETAQLMIRAALTGHLVFSTLHTNDAPGAIPRLVDMGVEPYLLPASMIGVLAQRLVRTMCDKCCESVEDPARMFEESGIKPPEDLPMQLWQGAGCPDCQHTGYRGRKGIFEWMNVDESLHSPIVRRVPSSEFLKLARASGMRTMFEDGVRKAMKKVTTIEEVLRATRLSSS